MVHFIKKQYTLIELLVVLSVISILSALLVPALNMAKAHGEQVECTMNLRLIGLAGEMYHQDNNGNLFQGNFVNSGYAYQETLAPYMDIKGPLWLWPDYNYTDESDNWNCPSSNRYISNNYAFNQYGFLVLKKVIRVKDPDEIMHFADQYKRGGNAYDYGCWTYSSASNLRYQAWSRAARHFESNEVLFLDGHVDQIEVTTTKAPAELCY